MYTGVSSSCGFEHLDINSVDLRSEGSEVLGLAGEAPKAAGADLK